LKRIGTTKQNENNVSKACVLTVLKRFGTAEKILKTLIGSKVCVLTVFGTTEQNENNVSKACVLTVLKRFGTAEKILKKIDCL